MKSWGGEVEFFILVTFGKDTEKNKNLQDPSVAIVVWEEKDGLLLGKPSDAPANEVSSLKYHRQRRH